MLGVLLTRQWLIRLVAGLALAIACVALGLWQLDRLDQRTARNAIIEANAGQDARPLDSVLPPDTPVDESVEWIPIQVTGQYAAGHTLLLRLRPVNGTRGVHVLTPLVIPGGDVVLVNRGFLPGADDGTTVPPPPPSGTVTATGRLRASESGRGLGGSVDSGLIRYVDLDELAAGSDLPLYGGWLQLVDEDGAAPVGLEVLPEPKVESGPHLSYAIQWFLFALIGVGGFIFLVRAEANASARSRAAEPTQLQRHGP